MTSSFSNSRGAFAPNLLPSWRPWHHGKKWKMLREFFCERRRRERKFCYIFRETRILMPAVVEAPISKKLRANPKRWGPLAPWPPFISFAVCSTKHDDSFDIVNSFFLFWLALNAYNVVLKLKIYKKIVFVIFRMQKWDNIFLAWNCALPGNDFCDGHG